MNAILRVMLLGVLLAVHTTAGHAIGQPPPMQQGHDPALADAGEKIRHLIWRLQHGEIGQVEIMTDGDVIAEPYPPQELERNYAYKLTIADIRRTPFKDGLLQAVQSVGLAPSTRQSAVKWVVVFYDLKGNRTVSLYLETGLQTGAGAVDGTEVTFRGRLAGWLEANIPLLVQRPDSPPQPAVAEHGGPGQAKFDATLAKMTGPGAKWLEILVARQDATTPEKVQQDFAYKLRIETGFFGPFLLNELAGLARTATVKGTAESPGLRWRIESYNEGGASIGVFYLDAAGTAGLLDGAPVAIEGGFGAWLNARFTAYFR